MMVSKEVSYVLSLTSGYSMILWFYGYTE